MVDTMKETGGFALEEEMEVRGTISFFKGKFS